MRGKLLVVVLTGFSLAACQVAPEALKTEVRDVIQLRLVMSYRPDVQFTPFYVADARGYFAENGLEIDFNHMNESESVQLVGADELQFAVVSGEQVLLARAQGLPVVYVMAWWHDYPIAVAAPEEAVIDTPADLVGKRIGFPGYYGASYIGFRALLSANGLTEEEVFLEPVGFTQVEALYEGRVDAAVVYANNEPLQLEAQGFPVTVFRVADYVQLASNGLITNEKTVTENPDLIRRMVRAILRGIEDTIDDPAGAYEIAKGYVEGLAEADDEVQRGVLSASIEFWKTEQPGFSDPVAWENMQSILLEMELLKEPLDLSQAYDNAFLP
ncbi:MAG: ABC transporter substrate-binding protein [Anaerolineales bacterium]|nr:ABC transporter substrate-binding protein [Anaerolineales bacterium]